MTMRPRFIRDICSAMTTIARSLAMPFRSGHSTGPGQKTGHATHRRSSSKPGVLGDMGERQRSRRALWERVKRQVSPQQRHATFRETWALIHRAGEA